MCSPFEGKDIPCKCPQRRSFMGSFGLDQHGEIFASIADKEAAFWSTQRGNSMMMKFLLGALQGGRIDKLMRICSPTGQSLFDAFIQGAARPRVEADPFSQEFWIQYMHVLSILHDLRSPAKPKWGRLRREEDTLFLSPMCWDGVVGLVVGVAPSCFNPFTWGAYDFLAKYTSNSDELHAFYIHLAMCVLDWEVQAPQMQMLNRYRHLGGSTRMCHTKILDLLPQLIRDCVRRYAKSYRVGGDPEKQEEIIAHKVDALTAQFASWQRSERLWSCLLCRTLAAKMPKPCVKLVDRFLLGSIAGTAGSMPEASSIFVGDKTVEGFSCDQNKDCIQDVIQQVVHVDPPTRIDAHEAALITAEQHVSLIEHQIGAASAPEPVTSNEQEKIFFVQFKRCPKELPIALSQGLPLKMCRRALEDAGHNWNLPNGDMVFVQPWQYRAVMHAHAHLQVSNCFSIIFCESFEYLVEESIQNVGKGALAKNRSGLHLQCDASDGAQVAAEEVESLMGSDQESDVVTEPQILRTFIHFALRYCLPSDAVTQSSTEADKGGLNPRRVCTACSFQ
mmetsp:Transcript_82483/g.156972  ORF Transcript_82483/g.156972 Transcript_82483/m.156972 type:complete len:561 (+) Transcript_82483:50-1732(+)